MCGKIKRLRNIQEFELSGFKLFGLDCTRTKIQLWADFMSYSSF